MGKALLEQSAAARAVFAEADDALGENLSRVILEGPVEELKRTRTTQPAILTMSIACLRALEETGVLENNKPSFAAGHSLGEYSALVAAGSIGFADAVRAVAARGTFMQEAVPEGQGAMAAVLGLDAAKIVEIVATTSTADAYVACANFNGPEQTVIAGTIAGVEAATVALKAGGAKRVLPLPVSAPFHCALMAPVQQRLATVLSSIACAAPKFPIVTNVDAKPNQDAARIRSLLIDQVTAPVRFTEIVQFMKSAGVSTFVEVGPGKALIGMVKRIVDDASQVTMLNVEDPASLLATTAKLRSVVPA